jgi:hypothetical protein
MALRCPAGTSPVPFPKLLAPVFATCAALIRPLPPGPRGPGAFFAQHRRFRRRLTRETAVKTLKKMGNIASVNHLETAVTPDNSSI